MKCISRRFLSGLCILLMTMFFAGCAGNTTSSFPYSAAKEAKSLNSADVAAPFSRSFAVAGEEEITLSDVTFDEDESAGLICLDDNTVYYAHELHVRRDPASLTKVMTALIAIENGALDQMLTASTSSYITDDEAQMIELKKGDTMTLHQALHFLLVYSANDVAMLIAEGISGDVSSFVKLMNEKATELGATNTHFTNPHGLTEDDQYTTAYDMYLIFNAAIRHEVFQQIIRLPSYKTQFRDADGDTVELDVRSTNAFVREGSGISAPAGATVIGGKTGSTFAAGQCLILLTTDMKGASYISVYMHAPDTQSLYAGMNALLELTLMSQNN